MGRFKALGAIVLLLCATGLLYAPSAWAHSSDLIEASASALDGAGDPVDKALDKANQASDETTDVVDKTTDRVTDDVDETTGGNEGDRADAVIQNTNRTIDENVGHMTGPNGPVRKAKQQVKDALEDATGQGSGNGSAIAGGGIDGFVDGNNTLGGRHGAPTAFGADRSARQVDSRLGATDGANESGPSEGSAPSLLEQIKRRAAELLQAAAFPLILILVIGAFLMIQNRIDSSDPKLALSAIDADQNYLTFR
jgi:hypothetical protein